ncbi:SDR family NAD(P)-dependent oxidoreductase [Pseudofrankia inefficax]|uniref:Short-chain dehydrogenase/reductase SDR n=1 Tax=Pseudofrankia inefficax (strain DSM 45817 / CECT 9037 / DDB 130130 / EuI1c) TaxID=298654 RepID=E3J491_PSEI1|nr:SDR family oxidoreductase [Pseudofrankia inefficax]ADP83010.1 short-chain dehydrogenase/reductase SDR [Pseudofrankia inefficax]
MPTNPVALITGGSRGLGRALAGALADGGWRVVVDGRDAARLAEAVRARPSLVAVAGDVTDPAHRRALVDAATGLGRLDLVVANASDLGPSPLPALAVAPLDAVRTAYETNVLAPLALAQLTLPALRASGGTWLAVSSDAAVEAYPGWGVYGPTKAALDHLTAVLGAEEPAIRAYAVDPGDMLTEMHQRAFPGEDISDRPRPELVAPAILRLLETRPPSGRYRAAVLASAAALAEAAR